MEILFHLYTYPPTHIYTHICPGLWCKTYFLLGTTVQNKLESHSPGNIKLGIPACQWPFTRLDHSALFKTKVPYPPPPYPLPSRVSAGRVGGLPAQGCHKPLDSSFSEHRSRCTVRVFQGECPQAMGHVLGTYARFPLQTMPGLGQQLRGTD